MGSVWFLHGYYSGNLDYSSKLFYGSCKVSNPKAIELVRPTAEIIILLFYIF